MTWVLTRASNVTCNHSGAVSTTGNARLAVDGQDVIPLSGLTGKSISGCPTPVASSPTTKPCGSVTAVTVGQSTRLFVDGEPVMLESLAGGTDGVDPAPGSLTAAAQQSRLESD